MGEKKEKLEWAEKYSVEVVEIDEQHKKMVAVINELIDTIDNNPTKEQLEEIIKSLVEYKQFHFLTEEKYFKEFNYEGAEEHIAKHNLFGEKLEEIQTKYNEDTLSFAFALIDFIEDWLTEHLMNVDQKYKACFKEHGLK